MNKYDPVFITYTSDELYHYGVKGMKWGVRRAIGQKAKIAANLERRSKVYSNDASRALNKQQKLESKRFTKYNVLKSQGRKEEASKYAVMPKKERKLNERYRRSYETSKIMNEARNMLVSDISEKDIEQGRRAIYKSAALTALVVPPAFAGAAAQMYDDGRANKYLKEHADEINKRVKESDRKRYEQDLKDLKMLEQEEEREARELGYDNLYDYSRGIKSNKRK